LPSHPRNDLIEEDRDKEHPFSVGEMGDGDDTDLGPPLLGVKEAFNTERFTLDPCRKPPGREQVVDPHGQLEPGGRLEERLKVEDPHPVEGWFLYGSDESFEIQAHLSTPGMGE
jgi:hypothetical protein